MTRKEENLLTLVGKNIKILRKEKKITQEQLAKKINLSTNYVSYVENGKRLHTLKILNKIAIALEAPIGIFFNSTAEIDFMAQLGLITNQLELINNQIENLKKTLINEGK